MNLFDLRQALLPDGGEIEAGRAMACLLGIPWTASPVLSPAMRRYSRFLPLAGWLGDLGQAGPGWISGSHHQDGVICMWLFSCPILV